MHSLQGFSDAATPVFADLGKAAPALTDATRTLTPFTAASTVALKSLGASGAIAGPKLREADPVVKKAAEVARSGVGPTSSLSSFFASTKETGGFNGLVELIYNTTATLNGFDQYGHLGRTLIILSNCLDYAAASAGECDANFTGSGARSSGASTAALYRRFERLQAKAGGTTAAPATSPETPASERPGASSSAARSGGTAPLLNYLLSP